MHITMVKKLLADGRACRKCEEAEAMLKRRGLWEKVDAIAIAKETDPDSEGMQLAAKHQIDTAPFFIVSVDGNEHLYTSPLKLIKAHLKVRKNKKTEAFDIASFISASDETHPEKLVHDALSHFGDGCAIAFSGAEDVALIHMAHQSGKPFKVFTLDTGRLHPETLAYVETVRNHYGITIEVLSPEKQALESFVRERGLFSFYEEGHKDCCFVRKVSPLKTFLSGTEAWMTGQRRDQSPDTRGSLDIVEADDHFTGKNPGGLIKFNPLAAWNREEVWDFLKRENVPTNPLHKEGFKSIGCAPCTRPTRPDQHEREGRWWWEDAQAKECGLHQTELPSQD